MEMLYTLMDELTRIFDYAKFYACFSIIAFIILMTMGLAILRKQSMIMERIDELSNQEGLEIADEKTKV